MGRLFVPFLQLQMMLLIAIRIIIIQAAENENARVISIVEQFEDDTTWEFHSKSVRRAKVSKRTWDEYIKYKEQTCRLEADESAESKAKGYLNWEEMTFHRSLRSKLLPSLTTNNALSYEDAVMLSNVDSRLLSPEPDSLCKIDVTDDSDQNEIAERSRFEDTLINCFEKKYGNRNKETQTQKTKHDQPSDS
ncbi:unnamed protein product [Litomosoides sigmodontis]|uniref:MADF domain-containing protein n=1 Tax=Litomosoides sigmodontis TaxID=42156 RepID=A0A3P6SC05_LITSI|nr:unnamed protein product [Litomosoides sigmodontis]